MRTWTVYLAGEIHSSWRAELIAAAEKAGLDVTFVGPVTDHDASDHCGVRLLGDEDSPFWRDRKGALVNALRTRTLIGDADVVVVRFGEQYRQWNGAFDAGVAAAQGLPLITLHDESLDHALKEIDAASCAVCRDLAQVIGVLRYAKSGLL